MLPLGQTDAIDKRRADSRRWLLLLLLLLRIIITKHCSVSVTSLFRRPAAGGEMQILICCFPASIRVEAGGRLQPIHPALQGCCVLSIGIDLRSTGAACLPSSSAIDRRPFRKETRPRLLAYPVAVRSAGRCAFQTATESRCKLLHLL